MNGTRVRKINSDKAMEGALKSIILILSIFFLNSCSRTFILSGQSERYEKSIRNLNSIGKSKECRVTVKSGFTFVTDSLAVQNDLLIFRSLHSDSIMTLDFKEVTSIYYDDHWAGFFEGGLLGFAIGFSVGYVTLPEWRDFGGAEHYSPQTGGCCIGTLGGIAGATFGGVHGVTKMYEISDDTSSVDTAQSFNLFRYLEENN